MNQSGSAETLDVPAGQFEFPRVSPDGKRIAFGVASGNEAAVSIYDLSSGTLARRVTFGGNNRFPIWSGDGKEIAFQSDRDGDRAIFVQQAEGGAALRLTHPEPGVAHVPESWSPDGKVLLYSASRDSAWSLWTLAISGHKAAPFSNVRDLSLPPDAVFSPDGRWVAYQMARETVGRPLTEGTTYVEAFPPTGTIYEIGPGGRPMWSRNGQRLFFVPAPGRFLSVSVTTEPTFTVTTPVDEPRRFGLANPTTPRTFDVLHDGRLVVVGTPGFDGEIRVVVNWFDELKRLAPAK